MPISSTTQPSCLVCSRPSRRGGLTARLAQAGARIWELPISYSGRTYAEGKKITWRDGMAAMFHILRYNLFPPAGSGVSARRLYATVAVCAAVVYVAALWNQFALDDNQIVRFNNLVLKVSGVWRAFV